MSWGCVAPKNKGKFQYGKQGTVKRKNLKELWRKCMEGTEGVDIGKTSWDSVLKTVDIGPRNVGLVFLGRHRALHRFEKSPNRNPVFCAVVVFVVVVIVV